MSWQGAVIIALCIWSACLLVAYLREYVLHKWLRRDLDLLLISLTAQANEPGNDSYAMKAYQHAAKQLEDILNK